MMNTTVDKFVERVNHTLEKLLSADSFDVLGTKAGSPIEEGYLYAVKDGGKRIRPICVYLGALSTGKPIEEKHLDKMREFFFAFAKRIPGKYEGTEICTA